jgi:hypothetical protein
MSALQEDRLTDDQLAAIAAARAELGEADGDVTEETGDVAEEEGAEAERTEEETPEPTNTKDMEEIWKKIERKADAYKKGMDDLLKQTDLPWQESPFDQVPGFLLPFNPNAPEALVMKQAADAYFLAGEPKYVQHPTMEHCDACDGWGKMNTGSREPQNAWFLCWKCSGKGFVDKTLPPATPPVPFVPYSAPQTAYTPPQPLPGAPAASGEPLSPPPGWHGNGKPGADTWDRWPGHPRYGIDPAMNGGLW